MASTFSLILAIVTLLTGIIWTVDKLVWSKQRAAKIAAARANAGSNIDEKTLAKVAPMPVWIEQTGGVFPVIALVLGIGNVLWADEGFGVRAVEALHEAWALPGDVTLMDGGTQGLVLLSEVTAHSHVLVFDAVDFGELGRDEFGGGTCRHFLVEALLEFRHQCLATADMAGFEDRGPNGHVRG